MTTKFHPFPSIYVEVSVYLYIPNYEYYTNLCLSIVGDNEHLHRPQGILPSRIYHHVIRRQSLSKHHYNRKPRDRQNHLDMNLYRHRQHAFDGGLSMFRHDGAILHKSHRPLTSRLAEGLFHRNF